MFFATACLAISIPMRWVNANGHGKLIGRVKAEDTIYGVLFTPHLYGLPPGVHGFHVHAFPSCANYAKAAGSHLDPVGTGVHRGPYRGNGHLGDLPVLIVDRNGRATLPVLAPRLKLASITGHSLMIHAGGDDYSEDALKHPGSKVRIACGVIPYF
ncbi:MAG: superoxide dismutase family protein [Gammaproteobacteria bacterium]|nr:superoxide dismutase family protein [Gammaproteobacteria bacterium]